MIKNDYIFSLEEVSFKFSKNKPYFFHNISLNLKSGMHYFVCGKNGVGKSTFFRIMQANIHVEEYCTGKIKIQDVCVDIQQDKSYGKFVRLLQQDVNTMLVDMLTVKENLQCALFSQFPGFGSMPEAVGIDILRDYGIYPDQQVISLSGGQRQILAIVMVLQKPTYILLLDEPTAALDVDNANKVMEFIKNIAKKQNLIVIIISHDVELVSKYTHNNNSLIIEEHEDIRQIRRMLK